MDTRNRNFDVLVIGGGISGAASAAALAQAGYNVALVEQRDFAAATSGRTSRLQYFGLSWLEGFQDLPQILKRPGAFLRALHQARLSLKGRSQFLRRAPHRLTPLEFFIPEAPDVGLSLGKLKLAMRMMQGLDPFGAGVQWRVASAEEASRFPTETGRAAQRRGIVYTDYQYAWPEAVVLDRVAELRAAGGVALNHTSVTALAPSGTGWTVSLSTRRAGVPDVLHARAVVNCAGIWADALAQGIGVPKLAAGEKGSNLCVRLPDAYLGRGMQGVSEYGDPFYVIPWGELHYLGPIEAKTDDERAAYDTPTDSEVRRLLAEARRQMPGLDPSEIEALFVWSGTRPRSRDRNGTPSGKLRVLGPGRTGQRHYFAVTAGLLMLQVELGRRVLDAVCADLGTPNARRSVPPGLRGERPGVPDAAAVARMVREGAMELDDVMFRRTALGWGADMGVGSVDGVASAMAAELGWSPADTRERVASYRANLAKTFRFGRLGAPDGYDGQGPAQPHI